MSKRWKVLLCGYYGMGNIGDELLASATIHLLEKHGISKAQIAMLSGAPNDSVALHEINAFDRWNRKEIIHALKDSESLLLGGGGIFQDSSSVRSPWYYWLVVRGARYFGCKIWAVGQSIGPLSLGLNRLLTRDALRLCGAVSVRDKHSADFLKDTAIRTDDLVLSLPDAAPCQKGQYLLVNFRPTANSLENAAAAALNSVLPYKGLKTIGVAMDREDVALMKEMFADGRLMLDEIVHPSVKDLPALFAGAEAGWGMRLHFGVLCLKNNVPCTLVPYDPKVRDFAERWGGKTWQMNSVPEDNKPVSWTRHSELADVEKQIDWDFSSCLKRMQIL